MTATPFLRSALKLSAIPLWIDLISCFIVATFSVSAAGYIQYIFPLALWANWHSTPPLSNCSLIAAILLWLTVNDLTFCGACFKRSAITSCIICFKIILSRSRNSIERLSPLPIIVIGMPLSLALTVIAGISAAGKLSVLRVEHPILLAVASSFSCDMLPSVCASAFSDTKSSTDFVTSNAPLNSLGIAGAITLMISAVISMDL